MKNSSFQMKTGESGDYMAGMDLTAATKSGFVLQSLPQDTKSYVDIGSGTGKVPGDVVRALESKGQKITAHAVEFNPKYIDPKQPVQSHIMNFLEEDLPMELKGADAASLIGFVHEMATSFMDKGGDELDAKIATLDMVAAKLRKILRPGGRIIIRDPAPPQFPERILTVTFGSLSAEQAENAKKMNGRGGLAPLELMKKFVAEYIPAQGAPIRASADGNSFTMPAWLVQEYFMMRTFNYSPDDWAKEAHERRAVFNREDIVAAARRNNLKVLLNETVHEKDYYADVHSDEDIHIFEESATPGVPHELDAHEREKRFPSHLYAVLEVRPE